MRAAPTCCAASAAVQSATATSSEPAERSSISSSSRSPRKWATSIRKSRTAGSARCCAPRRSGSFRPLQTAWRFSTRRSPRPRAACLTAVSPSSCTTRTASPWISPGTSAASADSRLTRLPLMRRCENSAKRRVQPESSKLPPALCTTAKTTSSSDTKLRRLKGPRCWRCTATARPWRAPLRAKTWSSCLT